MRIGRRVNDQKADDRGISLVELIVVMSILVILTGVASVSLSVMFTKDADYVAHRIDDALTETRMLSMSRKGNWTFVLHYDNSNSTSGYVLIMSDEGGTDTEYKKVMLDKDVTIKLTGNGIEVPSPASKNLGIIFNKSKGNVQEIGNVSLTSGYSYTKTAAGSGEYIITIESGKNSSRKSTVTIAATTGRHRVKQ